VQLEFQEYYEDMFQQMKEFLERIMIVKVGTVDRCKKNETITNEDEKLKIRSFEMDGLLKLDIDVLLIEYAIEENEKSEDSDQSSNESRSEFESIQEEPLSLSERS
jgi:hypothetical protein